MGNCSCPISFHRYVQFQKKTTLIISPERYNVLEDIVIAFITSSIPESIKHDDYLISEWKNSGLPKPSHIRMKFSTISQSVIIKKIGMLTLNDRNIFQNKLIDFFTN